MTSRVFVVQQHLRKDRESGALKSHDYSTAEAFGAVSYLVPARQFVEAEYGGDVEALLKDKLKDFTVNDFIIPSGDPVLCAQAVLAAVARLYEGDKLKMLKWDNRSGPNGSYTAVEITVPL